MAAAATSALLPPWVRTVRLADLQLPSWTPRAYADAQEVLKDSLHVCGAAVLEVSAEEAEQLGKALRASAQASGWEKQEGKSILPAAQVALMGKESQRELLEDAAQRVLHAVCCATSPVSALLSSESNDLSFFRYQPSGQQTGLPAAPSGKQRSLAAAAHVDRGLFTLIYSPGEGLELVVSGAWHFTLAPNQVAVLSGELLHYISEGELQRGVHQVARLSSERFSSVLRIRAPPSLPLQRGPGKFGRFATVGEFEKAFLESHMSINAPPPPAPAAAPAAVLAPDPAPEPAVAPRASKRAKAEVEQSEVTPASAVPTLAEEAVTEPSPGVWMIAVRSMDEQTITFKVSGSSKVRKVLAAYAKKMAVNLAELRFIVRDGDQITARERNMAVDDFATAWDYAPNETIHIDAFMPQCD